MCISNNCVYDIDGDGCEEYAAAAESGTSACTGAWDTADFTATCDCCECGGGITVSNSGDDSGDDGADDCDDADESNRCSEFNNYDVYPETYGPGSGLE
jgi:hypothetical protein